MSVRPWLTLATVIWLQAISGTNTDFPAYSSELKSRLNITQVKLNNLAFASDAGKLFGWCAGAAAARLPLWSVLSIGVILGAIGYGVQFLYMSNIISSLSYTQFFFLNMLNGNSICWFNTVGYITVMRQFWPEDHGTIIALTTSYTGLTAKIYVALADLIVGKYNAAGSENKIYLLLNAVTPVVIGLLAVMTIWTMRERQKDVKVGLVMMFGIAGVTGTYAVMEATVPALRNSSGVMPETILLVMVAAVVLVPVSKVGEWVACRGREEGKLSVEASGVGDVEGGKKEEEEEVAVVEMEVAGRKGSLRGVAELFKQLNFWVYFMVYLCGATLGLVYGNNLGQISQSRGVSKFIMISVYSAFGFFGRLATAPLSIFSRSKFTISKVGAIDVLMVFMSASFFIPLSSRNSSLFLSTAIIGGCSGAISSIAVSVSAELFGQENFGVNHNIVISNIPIGSFLFGSIAALIYDERENASAGRDRICVGTDCYRKTFIIWGCICSFGTVLCFVLFCRTRRHLIPR